MSPTAMPYRIVFVAGAARSGSTFLEARLAQAEATVAVGELGYIWERGVAADHQCSCGASFQSCPFWSSVMETAYARTDGPTVEQMAALAPRVTRTRRILSVRRPALRSESFARDLRDYTQGLRQLYDAIHAVSGATTIIDSTKYPHVAVVPSVQFGNVTMVHLVRDARAVAHSWSQVKPTPGSGRHATFGTRSASEAARIWARVNTACEAVAKIVPGRRLRYEDFGWDIARLRTELGLHPSTAEPVVHSFSGNPMRFSDDRAFRLDRRWLHDLAPRDRRIVTAITAPLLVRYGYLPDRSRDAMTDHRAAGDRSTGTRGA